ncbi:MAG: hypothetical protein KDC61_20085 [Saprospiraceae bacterium]|nr:hypothetical protein [Saprospiraceae bacterium]MCB0576869.1 hypothetical protein [Saprospiraceae bacterium]
MGPINWKLILLLSSVFFAGVIVRGEFARRQDIKRRLQEIEDNQGRIMAHVDSINTAYAARKLELTKRTDSLYMQIDEILRLKSLNAQRINRLQNSIADQRQQLYLEIHDLQEVIDQHPVGIKQNN